MIILVEFCFIIMFLISDYNLVEIILRIYCFLIYCKDVIIRSYFGYVFNSFCEDFFFVLWYMKYFFDDIVFEVKILNFFFVDVLD